MATFGGVELTPEEVSQIVEQAQKEGWVHRDLVALDQFANVLFFNGMPDETMSSHFQRMADAGNEFGKIASGMLNIIQKRHGQQAQAGDIGRAEAVEKVEKPSFE